MRGEERRALILAEAKKIFAEKSYRGASTGALARASGISEPILYKHFGSKKKLYTTVLTLIGEQFLDRFRGMVERRAENDLTDCLSNLLLDYRKAGMQDHDGIHLLLNAMLESDEPDVAEITQRHNREMYALVFGLLEKAQKQGFLSQTLDLSAATWGFLSFLFALQYRAKTSIYEDFSEQIIREINRLWLQSLHLG
jgi:AcrR family transcriptional regulator